MKCVVVGKSFINVLNGKFIYKTQRKLISKV